MTSDITTLLTDMLIYVGAYAQGQTANPDDIQLAWRVVNYRLDSLSAEKLTMVGMSAQSYPLDGSNAYTFGPGMEWNAAARPIKIKAAATQTAYGAEYPARITTADQWAAIEDKTRTGLWAEDIYYDNGFPSGNIYVSPMPAGGQMTIWAFEAIPQLPSPPGSVDLAPGYTQAILAIAASDLCIAFQRPLTPDLANATAQSKDVIVQLNAELFNAPAPPPAGPSPVSPPALRAT